jgi:CRP-like cAMP-binding protein
MPLLASPEKIKDIPLFAGLTEKEKGDLLKEGRLHRYSKGEHLFLHGDPLHFLVVCRGNIRLFRSDSDGHETTTDIAIPGKTVGKLDIFQGSGKHMVSAQATTDEVVVMEFPITWLRDAVKKYNVLALNVLSAISRYAFMAEVDAEHQATMSAAQLVACLLQRICILHGFDPQGFELPYSKSLIASRLGMELETFSRTLPKLSEHGITVDGNHVSINDLFNIESYVCSQCSISEDCPSHQTLHEMAVGKTAN